MIKTREEAAKAAEAAIGKPVTPRTCQLWTRTIYGAPSVGDVDGDGASDAEDGWKAEPEWAKHTDRNPPRGVPVYFSGGSEDNGHRAISLDHQEIAGVDAPHSGKIGSVDIGWFETEWKLNYVGWTETISGIRIPEDPPPLPPNPPKKGSKVSKAVRLLRVARDAALKKGHTQRAKALTKIIQALLKLPKKK